MKEAPLPWIQFNNGGPRDQRESYARSLMKTHYKDTGAACSGAIRSGRAQPALDAVNTLQAVPWRINTAILDVIQECLRRGLDVAALPGETLPRPFPPEDEGDESAMRLWKLHASRVRKHNRMLVGKRLMITEDMETAERMRDWPAFWTPMNLDFRGRVNAMTSFNFQREDRVRALFNFAKGEPIGEDGLWWLKVHVANCAAFDKIDKKPLEDRVAWVDKNLKMLRHVATNPMGVTELTQWTKAENPFLFLAACHGAEGCPQCWPYVRYQIAGQLRRKLLGPAAPVCDDPSARGSPGQPYACNRSGGCLCDRCEAGPGEGYC
jgi:DNA-directed RNA polymerase